MRAFGALLLAAALGLGGVAALWTLWRALGAEADFCRGANCITAYWITLPALGIALALGWASVRLLRRDG